MTSDAAVVPDATAGTRRACEEAVAAEQKPERADATFRPRRHVDYEAAQNVSARAAARPEACRAQPSRDRTSVGVYDYVASVLRREFVEDMN